MNLELQEIEWKTGDLSRWRCFTRRRVSFASVLVASVRLNVDLMLQLDQVNPLCAPLLSLSEVEDVTEVYRGRQPRLTAAAVPRKVKFTPVRFLCYTYTSSLPLPKCHADFL